jgi:hypothetical protein
MDLLDGLLKCVEQVMFAVDVQSLKTSGGLSGVGQDRGRRAFTGHVTVRTAADTISHHEELRACRADPVIQDLLGQASAEQVDFLVDVRDEKVVFVVRSHLPAIRETECVDCNRRACEGPHQTSTLA